MKRFLNQNNFFQLLYKTSDLTDFNVMYCNTLPPECLQSRSGMVTWLWMGGCRLCRSCQSPKSPTDSERCKFDLFCLSNFSVIIKLPLSYKNAFLFPMQRIYKKDAKDNFGKFTHIVDRPEIVLAKVNAFNLSDVSVSQIWPFSSSQGITDVKRLAYQLGPSFCCYTAEVQRII